MSKQAFRCVHSELYILICGRVNDSAIRIEFIFFKLFFIRGVDVLRGSPGTVRVLVFFLFVGSIEHYKASNLPEDQEPRVFFDDDIWFQRIGALQSM